MSKSAPESPGPPHKHHPTMSPTHSEHARPPETVSERGSAYLLALTMGSEGLPPAAALEELRQRVARLRDPTSPAALEELSGHLPLLDALWQRMAAEAVRAKRPDDRVRLLRAALHAQAAYGRTVALLHGLELQRRGLAVVSVNGRPGRAPSLGHDGGGNPDDLKALP